MAFHKQENVFGFLDIWDKCQKPLNYFHQWNLYKDIWQIFLTPILHLNYIKANDKSLAFMKYITMIFLMWMSLFVMTSIIAKYEQIES